MKKLRLAFLCSLAVAMLVLAGCSKFNRIQKRGTVDEKLDAALIYFEKKDWFKASTLLEEIIPLLRGSDRAEKAQFYFAYTHFYMKQLVLSSYYFKQFYETFPNSKYAEEAMYMYAISLYEDSPPFYLDQENTFKALDAIENYQLAYPNNKNKDYLTGVVNELNAKLERKAFELARLFQRKENWKAATIALANFQKDYPESKFGEEAQFLLVQASYDYARNSVAAKQAERYDQVLENYLELVDRYPSSKYLKQAEALYDEARRNISKLETTLRVTN